MEWVIGMCLCVIVVVVSVVFGMVVVGYVYV